MCRPNSTEYAEYLRRWGTFHGIGVNCHILPVTNVMDPAYVRIGDNVALSGCTLIGHDGVVGVVQRAHKGLKVDSVGYIDIKDDCYVGWGAIILPGTTIGPRTVIGAGAVVKGVVPPNSVVVGNPARVVCTWDEMVAKLERQTRSYPWAPLIEGREGDFDADIEDELVRMRVAHWFEDDGRPRRATSRPLQAAEA